MTTQQFLINNLGRTAYDKRWCSSVMVDYQGIAYSYGYHYPLARIINGQAYINTRGYSMTTSRHIWWAKSAAASLVGWNNVHDVDLISGGSLNERDIILSLERTIAQLTDTMATKKRQDTHVYQDLTNQRDSAIKAMAAIESESLVTA